MTSFERLEVLFDTTADAGSDGPLAERYGGPLTLADDLVYANFVATIDGVAAVRTRPRSSAEISGGAEADRFVMAVLRAGADAIVVGAGTLRAHLGTRWTAVDAAPFLAGELEDATADRSPRLVVVTSSGELDPSHPALEGALIATGGAGVARARTRLGADVEVIDAGPDDVDVAMLVEALRARGYRRILTEGGPSLFARFVEARAVDELFLTVSPRIAGRSDRASRPGIVDGVELPPETFERASLMSVRRGDDHLFLRYRFAGR